MHTHIPHAKTDYFKHVQKQFDIRVKADAISSALVLRLFFFDKETRACLQIGRKNPLVVKHIISPLSCGTEPVLLLIMAKTIIEKRGVAFRLLARGL
jgi:hypothetical protein